jgi:hypothetical protein
MLLGYQYEVGGESSTHERNIKCKFSSINLKGRDDFKRLVCRWEHSIEIECKIKTVTVWSGTVLGFSEHCTGYYVNRVHLPFTMEFVQLT